MICTDLPLSRSSSIASSRSSWPMQPALPPFERPHCSTKHLADHALRCDELADEASIVRAAPTRMPRRHRRQETRRDPELAAQPGRTPHRTRNTLRAIAELMANPARQCALVPVQIPTQRSTPRTAPVGLLAVNALLPDDLKRLRHAIDEKRDLLARGASMRGRGYPRGVFNGGFFDGCVACAEARDHGGEIYTQVRSLRLERQPLRGSNGG